MFCFGQSMKQKGNVAHAGEVSACSGQLRQVSALGGSQDFRKVVGSSYVPHRKI